MSGCQVDVSGMSDQSRPRSATDAAAAAAAAGFSNERGAKDASPILTAFAAAELTAFSYWVICVRVDDVTSACDGLTPAAEPAAAAAARILVLGADDDDFGLNVSTADDASASPVSSCVPCSVIFVDNNKNCRKRKKHNDFVYGN